VTTLGAAELQEKWHALCRRIDLWRDVQRVYMPCIDQVRATCSTSTSDASSVPSTSSTTSEEPETTPLYLPSSIPKSFWSTGCVLNIVNKERRLRLPQADDALKELRRQLHISATLVDYKKVQVGGGSQKMSTQIRSLLSRFHDKTICCAERYSATYNALSALDPNGDWTTQLKVLNHKTDLCPPCRCEDDESRETRRELSWIWLVAPGEGLPKAVASAAEINDSKSHKLLATLSCCTRTQAWDSAVLFVIYISST